MMAAPKQETVANDNEMQGENRLNFSFAESIGAIMPTEGAANDKNDSFNKNSNAVFFNNT